MSIFKSPLLKKLTAGIFVITLCSVLFVGLGSHLAYADPTATPQDTPSTGTPPGINFLDCVASPVTCAVYGMSQVAATVGSFFVAMGGWLVTNILTFNAKLSELSSIKVGFTLALALANLTFVLGIIVIAIATILRIQSYSIKQILGKLIIMAVLVNFSWLTAMTIINVSQQVTNYFLQPFNPIGTGDDAYDKMAMFQKFTDQLVGAFTPQALMQAQDNKNTPPVDPDNSALTNFKDCALGAAVSNPVAIKDCYALAKKVYDVNQKISSDQSQSQFWQVFLNLLFVSTFTFILAFILFSLAIILLIRFVMLAFLLILMPLAWSSWVFPTFSKNFSTWWQQFLRWTFYPPIVVFFLYLAILTSQQKDDFSTKTFGLLRSGNVVNSEAAIAAVINNHNAVDAAGKMILTIAIAIGGLFAASALSMEGAKQTMGALQSTASTIGRAGARTVGKRTAAYATDNRPKVAYQELTGKETRLQRLGIGLTNLKRGVIDNKGKGFFAPEKSKETKAKELQEEHVHHVDVELKEAEANERKLVAKVEEAKKKIEIANARRRKLKGELPAVEAQLTTLESSLPTLEADLSAAIATLNPVIEDTARRALMKQEKLVEAKKAEIVKKKDEITNKENEIKEVWAGRSQARKDQPAAKDEVTAKKKELKREKETLEDKTRTADRNAYEYGALGDAAAALNKWAERENRQPITVKGILGETLKVVVVDGLVSGVAAETAKAALKGGGVSVSGGGHAEKKHAKPAAAGGGDHHGH